MLTRIIIILFLFLSCLGSVANAQLQLDSLNKALSTAQGEDIAKLQLQIASRLLQIDLSKADSLVQIALSQSIENGYFKQEAMAYIIGASILGNLGKRDSAEIALQKALSISHKIQFPTGITAAHLNYGTLFIQKQEYENATYQHIKGLQASETDSTLQHYTLSHLMNLGVIMQIVEDFEKSEGYFKRALALATGGKNSFRIAQINANLGIVAYKQDNYGESIKFHKAALPIFISANANLAKARAYLNLGLAHLRLQDFDDSFNAFVKAEDAWKKLNDERGLHLTYRYIAEVYYELRQFDESREQISKSIPVLKKYAEHQYLTEAYEIWSKIEEAEGNNLEALAYYKSSKLYQDSVRLKNEESALNKALANYELKRLERENALEKEISGLKIQRQRELIVVICILFMFLIIIFFWYRFRLQNRLKIERLNRQLAEQEVLIRINEFESEKEDLKNHVQKLLVSNETLTQSKEALESQISENLELGGEVAELIEKLKDSISNEKDWTAFRLYFDRAYPQFFDSLHSTVNVVLTFNENRLISLIKIQLTNKEIATALNIQRDSVAKGKIRLKERLGFSKIKEMEDFILSIH